MCKFSDLVGKTLTDVRLLRDDTLVFTLTCGKQYRLYHEQDCCEAVYVESIVGELLDLIGVPILVASEVSSRVNPGGAANDESCTWTFYKLATSKGYVDIRWVGESNGYYSESVDFGEVLECQS